MKNKVLSLLKGMHCDSKKESRKCEKEICNIFNEIINKISSIEDNIGVYLGGYPEKITGVDAYCIVEDSSELPKYIECENNYSGYYDDFKFDTEWLEMNWEEYFNDLKSKQMSTIINIIENVEKSLEKHKTEFNRVYNLKYKI